MPTNLETVFSYCLDKIDHPVYAVETGCSFLWEEWALPFISTLNIVKYLVAPTGGMLYSLDNDKDKIAICRMNMDRLGLGRYVSFIHGDSVDSLYRLPANNVNFAWLDSSEDSGHAQSEFLALQLSLQKKHIVCVDDYGCQNSVKWQKISEAIKTSFDNYKEYDTPTGLIVGVRGSK